MHDHELRLVLNNELHERSGLPITAPCKITHMAFLCEEDSTLPHQAIEMLPSLLPRSRTKQSKLHWLIETDRVTVRFERHREFYRVAIVAPKREKGPHVAVDALPKEWLEALPGRRLVAVHTDVKPKRKSLPSASEIEAIFGHIDIAGASVSHGKAFAWTDFRVGADGFTRMLIQDNGLAPTRLGRVVRRMHEIETYRMMALLGLPPARDARPRIMQMERELSDLVAAMSRSNSHVSDSECLSQLVKLASEIESLSNSISYRLSASRAYADIVAQRVAEMAEARDRDFQRIGLFLDRRFEPAMATCRSVADQLINLAQRSERTSNLLRTRVDIALETQNQKLLESMEQRTSQQLRLQEAVEGLSVIAISYYAVQLFLKAMETATDSFHFSSPKWLPLAIIPLTVLAVWLFVQKIKSRHRNV